MILVASIACALSVGICNALHLQSKPFRPWERQTLASTAGDTMDSNSVDDMAVNGDGVTDGHAPPGYEYVHPDITELLLTPTSWGETGDCPFVVDKTSLLLKLQIDKVDNVDSTTTKFMPLHQLAYLAEDCERVVFEVELKDRISDNCDKQQVSYKILGLICLSNLSSEWPSAPDKSESNNAALLIATMVSLNLLESSIRSVIQSKRKLDQKNSVGAPLLRDMIETLSEVELDSNVNNIEDGRIDFKTLATILRALLLPTRLCGINLRNLISHGFLSSIDRRWFALVVVLIQTLDKSSCDLNLFHSNERTTNHQNRAATNLMKYESMAKVVSRGKEILLGDNEYLEARLRSNFIPRSYLHISEFIFTTLARPLQQRLNQQTGTDIVILKIPSLTTIYLIGASSLLEHSLRLQWCRANNKPFESIARPSQYYVTLDGHGQRDKHDVMISPFLGNGSRNLLIGEIGSASALLSDLFSAPSSEAPNIRSQLCHGTWDAEIIQELESLAHSILQINHIETQTSLSKSEDTTNGIITDAACALTASYEMLLSNILCDGVSTNYQPVYSYVAMWKRDLRAIMQDLTVLEDLTLTESIVDCIDKMDIKQSIVISDMLKTPGAHLDQIQYIQQVYLCEHTDHDTWLEYDINIALSDCIAAQTLLSEVSLATRKYIIYLQEAMDVLIMRPSSTKEKRNLNTTTRICGIASIVLDFYTTAAYICMLMMQCAMQSSSDNEPKMNSLTRTDYIKLIERTRMALSTFESYMEKNLERSLKALLQYLQSKVLKKVMSYHNDTVSKLSNSS